MLFYFSVLYYLLLMLMLMSVPGPMPVDLLTERATAEDLERYVQKEDMESEPDSEHEKDEYPKRESVPMQEKLISPPFRYVSVFLSMGVLIFGVFVPQDGGA